MELENDYVDFVQKISAIDKLASNKCVNEFGEPIPLNCCLASGQLT